VKYAFIREHQQEFSVAAMCRVLKVSRSGFYDWRDRGPSARSLANAALLADIRKVHLEHRQAYGALKTWQALKQQGIACGKHRIARLRAQAGIEARRKRRFRVMTEHHKTRNAPDLLQRRFQSTAPNRVWVGDMTFIRTRQGWLHLAVLLDVFSRRVVGWSMGNQADQQLSLSALNMALVQRQPKAGLVHHTDGGSPYKATAYRARLESQGLQASMNGRKSAYDNAVAESFFSNLKNELVHHSDFHTRDQARAAIFDYIELFYNRKRIHQSLDYRTPDDVERQWRGAALTCPRNPG